MSAIDLAGFADVITRERDRVYQQAADALARKDQGERGEALISWSAYALTLSALHTYTSGVYGTPYQDQPSPYHTPKVSAEPEQVQR